MTGIEPLFPSAAVGGVPPPKHTRNSPVNGDKEAVNACKHLQIDAYEETWTFMRQSL